MKFRFAAVALSAALLAASALSPALADSPAAQLARQEANTGVVLFNSYDATGHQVGAGAIIAFNQGSGEVQILTAAHVAILKNLSVSFADGTNGHVEQVRLASDGSDAALVTARIADEYLNATSLDAQDTPQYHVYRIAASKPQTGDPLTIVGHPKAVPWTVSRGTVSDVFTTLVALQGSSAPPPPVKAANYADFAFTCGDCAEGDSGGPVLNAAGEIVGIVSGAFEKDGQIYEACTQRENFATLLALSR
jgi:S1-C subfamily serine protease